MTVPEVPTVGTPVVEVGSEVQSFCVKDVGNHFDTMRLEFRLLLDTRLLLIMFMSNVSAISRSAWGSIHVETKVAKFSRELPSSINSSIGSCGRALAGDAHLGGNVGDRTTPAALAQAAFPSTVGELYGVPTGLVLLVENGCVATPILTLRPAPPLQFRVSNVPCLQQLTGGERRS